MNGRSISREVLVGLVVIASLGGLFGLLALAQAGPSYLTAKQTIDVVYRDGQGIRVGSPVRIAGIDAGQVVGVELSDESDGSLRARVRIALPTKLAKKLRQDVKITIQSGLTGQSRVNIVSSGQSALALVPNQVVQGVESTFFDPILEQVGFGPVERSHLSHTIGEVRQTVDAVGPRVRQIVAALQTTANGLRETSETLRPTLESAAGNVDELTKRINAASPRIEVIMAKLESVSRQVDAMLVENRPNLHASLANVKDISATIGDMATKDRAKIERLLDGLDGTRARMDRVLYQTDLIATQGVNVLTRSRADIERTIANVRDATDWGDKLVQKIYANPFVLSPFYKPTAEDLRVQVVYDTAQTFTKGAQELHDLVKTLDAMSAKASTPAQKQELAQIQRNVMAVTERLGQVSSSLAEGLKRTQTEGRIRR